MKRFALLASAAFVCGCAVKDQVGEGPDGSVTTPTKQLLRPAGETLTFNGRPLDLALSLDGKTLYAKDNRGVIVVESGTWKVKQELNVEGGSSMHGIVLSNDGKKLFYSNAGMGIQVGDIAADGSVKWTKILTMPKPKVGGDAYPCGMALTLDGKKLAVCLSRGNALGLVDLKDGSVKVTPVGMSPYDVKLSPDGRYAYVTNWGGHAPREGKKTAKSSESEVEVDERTIGSSGTVSVVDLGAMKEIKQVDVGLQPSDLVISRDGKKLFVANTNSDTVSYIDAASQKVVKTFNIRPDVKLPFGSAPNGIALSPDEKTLYVCNSANNAIGVFEIASGKRMGFIPTAWYPGSVMCSGSNLYIANIKGWGSRGKPDDKGGHSVYSFTGTLQKVAVPAAEELKTYTAQAMEDANVPETLKAFERSKAKVAAVALPAKLGEPSTIEHVFYIIKENRTYDQMLGDLSQADGEPKLCMFPREVTPNHHALAEEFVLLDNYYCNCVNSADGHAWCVEGEASAFLERSFGGWTRSYPFGDDPLSPCSSGFIWDNVLGHGLTFRNYGEFDYAEPTASGRTFKKIYDDFVAGKTETFKQQIGVNRLRAFSSRDFPGWNMNIPDVLRASRFIAELRNAKTWPRMTMITLPQDHNSGGAVGMPTPKAHTADNDLALGRIVEAISNSPFWKKTAIFVIEDDPQNGVDHVDGHRSLCLVISPYAKREQVISEFYNQSSVMHTMEQILGLPPMNQMDAVGPLMFDCFTSKPDYAPYKCLPNQIPLDTLNPSPSALKGRAKYLAEISAKQDMTKPDRVDDHLMAEAAWMATFGPSVPYPKKWAGAHGLGLAKKGLRLED